MFNVLSIFCFVISILQYGSTSLDIRNCAGKSGSEDIFSEQFLLGDVSPMVTQTVTSGERNFSVVLMKSLFEHFNKSDEVSNIFISPSSIYQALLLAYFGARGITEHELGQVLELNGVDKLMVLKHYLTARIHETARQYNPTLGYELTNANRFYVDNSIQLNECLAQVLNGDIESVDFSNNVKTTNSINAWVATQTKQKIPQLLQMGSLGGTTKVTLVNAAYFKGQWKSQFSKNDSKTDIFYVDRGNMQMVTYMKQKGNFNYYTSEELRAHVMEMPYMGDHISMVVILPPWEEDSLHKTVALLTPSTLQRVMGEIRSGFYQVDDLNVEIPKFKIEQSFQLEGTLSKLGLTSLFDSQVSDLSGFLKSSSDQFQDINLDSAIHKSFIEVNEEGSEAAGASALFGFRSARPLNHNDFIANHPFLFLIYDKKDDVILFFGAYRNPALSIPL